MLLIWYFLLNAYSVFCQYGVILSSGRSSDGIYEGYLWNNNKIVFISPELKATAVEGISKSEKICGFELRSRTVKDIPFTVYLLDELSGVGEMQVKPHVYLDYQSKKVFEFTVEAFDCDVLPHYSPGLFVGRCSLLESKRLAQSSGNKPNSLIDVGVISMIMEKPLKQDAIGCLSSCGETLVIADSITTLNNVKFQRQGSLLILTSANVPQLLDSPMKIHYINSFYTLRSENLKPQDSTDIWMDMSIECESKEIIKIPRSVMRINFIGPPRDITNDTNDVEITTNATITASVSNSIQIFPNLQFINVNTNNDVTKGLKIESCTIRLLQRNLVANEKIYLSEEWSPILRNNKLEIRSDLFLWSIEGETDGAIYEKILRNLLVDMIDERKKFSILCTLKGGDFTNQAVVEVIQLKHNNIHYTIEENPSDLFHQAISDKRSVYDRNKEDSFHLLNITKSKFIGVIIMAVIGGAAWALVTAAIICIVLRKKEYNRERKRINNPKNYSKDNISSPHQPPLVTTHDVFLEYEYEEDRTSMADIPDDEEQNLDNISCETCNMADPEVVISAKSIKDLPRSKTITFPIMHRKF